MKVAYTSDIHADITLNNSRLIPFLVKRIEDINPDVFVIAGDISNSLESLDNTLKLFSELSCLKVMVPGNHDVWVESNNSVRKGRDSFYKYRQAIPQVCQQNGFSYPITEPIIIGSTAIIGNIGWYDYSLADIRLESLYSFNDYAKGTFEEGTWNDTKYAVWLKSPNSSYWKDRLKALTNNMVFEMLFDELKNSVQNMPDNIGKLLVVLHTAPFKECIIPKDEPSPFDAYEGSTKIGEFIKSVSKNREVSIIFGHRHKKLFLDMGNIKLYRSPVGYLGESQTDYEKIAREVIGEFEV
ncbi:metallophosphoesterase [Pseudobacteroides cellulosolvens]|uniref:Metallophosphoesterase n=1 Tax=Pseudobacteroides cellulosolvens ATCC 35603 = DSM 2933 TaxID=398512 RepID=A0A0L6JLW6_9FIRM|nr:metallophosphoesterase [Pseudobacteroides cellulosolvens]KNY26397.1 metallophosphoesterase [Pseudobacteroides cellulosolvens ATCC 35603 = DSM 2933]